MCQASELQDILLRNPNFRPVKNVLKPGSTEEMEQVPDRTNERWLEVKRKHGVDVAEALMVAFQELDEWNPSGRYTTRIPWDAQKKRELTPAEVTAIIMSSVPTPRRGRR